MQTFPVPLDRSEQRKPLFDYAYISDMRAALEALKTMAVPEKWGYYWLPGGFSFKP